MRRTKSLLVLLLLISILIVAQYVIFLPTVSETWNRTRNGNRKKAMVPTSCESVDSRNSGITQNGKIIIVRLVFRHYC